MSEASITTAFHAFRVILTLTIIMATTQAFAKEPRDAAPAKNQNAGQIQKPIAATDEFRVEIHNSQKQPKQSVVGNHLILFSEGKTYGFSVTPPIEITIVDSTQRSVTLVSLDRQIRCKMAMDDLMGQTARVVANAKTPEIRERWGIDAVVKNLKNGEHTIQFGAIEYRSTIQPAPSIPIAVEFAKFADWASRLNLIRNMGVPPFGRMKLNESIASTGSIPKKIQLTRMIDGHQHVFESRYETASKLTEADRKRIQNVVGQMANFKQVSPVDF